MSLLATSQNKGRVCLLTASFLWAVEGALYGLAATSTTQFDFLALRNSVIVFSCLLTLVAIGGLPTLFQLTRKQALALFLMTVCSGVLADTGYYYALTHIPMVNALLIGHLQPFFMLLIGSWFFHEKDLTSAQIFGGTIMFLAAILVSAGSWEELRALRIASLGDGVVLLSAIFWAASTVVTKHYAMDVPTVTLTFYRYLGTLPVFLLIMFFFGHPQLGWYVTGNGLSVFVGICLYFTGLKVLPAPEVGFLELFSPLFGLLLGALFVGQQATMMQFVGSLLMFVGFYFLVEREPVTTSLSSFEPETPTE